ncbi:MAG: hypothetical protein AAFU79_02045 [Myxococcota bacterium]
MKGLFREVYTQTFGEVFSSIEDPAKAWQDAHNQATLAAVQAVMEASEETEVPTPQAG